MKSMEANARLIFEYGGDTTLVYELEPGREYVLGRSASCDIRIEEKSVSRKHLLIREENRAWHLRDVSGRNGIVVKGKQVPELIPRHGEKFYLGRVRCTFGEAGKQLSELTSTILKTGEPVDEEPVTSPEGIRADDGARGSEENEFVQTEQHPAVLPLVLCPVCGSNVQIIDIATAPDLQCHACAAQLGRLAERRVAELGGEHSTVIRSKATRGGAPTIGEYRVIREIGAGGMGRVFEGCDPVTGQRVAIKVLYAKANTKKEFADAFEKEAKALARIYHKNIVKIYRYGIHENSYYIAMEYVEGTNVKDLIEKKNRLPVDQAMEILRQALVALDHVHPKGIIHNDIKPGNIMLDREGVVKLTDFGIVQFGLEGDPMDLSSLGGTPGYLSPEVIKHSPRTPASDIYALGVTAYYMLCGHPPLRGKTPKETLKKHLREEPEHPSTYRELPFEVVSILARMLAKSRGDRYTSAKEILDDIDAMELGKNLDKKTIQLGRRWH